MTVPAPETEPAAIAHLEAVPCTLPSTVEARCWQAKKDRAGSRVVLAGQLGAGDASVSARVSVPMALLVGAIALVVIVAVVG